MTWLERAHASLRSIVNGWWRPIACVGLVVAIWVNGVWLPVVTLKPVEWGPLAAFVGALVGLFAVREVGKAWGTAK